MNELEKRRPVVQTRIITITTGLLHLGNVGAVLFVHAIVLLLPTSSCPCNAMLLFCNWYCRFKNSLQSLVLLLFVIIPGLFQADNERSDRFIVVSSAIASAAALISFFETLLARLTGFGPFVSVSGGFASKIVPCTGSRGVGHSTLLVADAKAI
eukprot:IDg12920t1